MAGIPKQQLEHHEGLTETLVESKRVYEGPFMKINCDTVRLPDGKQATREYVVHAGAVMVIPLLDNNRVLLERQYRYATGKVMIEYPAGKLDPNEDELTCAQRELEEETGYSASEYIFLTRIHPIISYSTEFIDIYLARGLTSGRQKLDEGEFIELFTADVAELSEWIRTGKVSDVKTIIGTFWLEKFLSGAWELPAPVGR
ncbi:NUDIX domain-containing protein [Paraburkholderia jirisanensis]